MQISNTPLKSLKYTVTPSKIEEYLYLTPAAFSHGQRPWDECANYWPDVAPLGRFNEGHLSAGLHIFGAFWKNRIILRHSPRLGKGHFLTHAEQLAAFVVRGLPMTASRRDGHQLKIRILDGLGCGVGGPFIRLLRMDLRV